MAGEGDAERLIVLLEARIRDFEKNMQKAAGTAETGYRRMRRGSKSATQQMEQDMQRSTSRINQMLASTSTKIGAFGKAFVGGIVGGVVAGGVAGVVNQIGEIARGVASIGDEAKRAGLSLQAFQELKYLAEQSRIGVDSLVDGLKELSLRGDEFVKTGAGPAAEAFGRLGYDAETLAQRLRDPSALFTEIIGKLGHLDRAAQIRIMDEVFGGTGGEKFVQLIEQGEDGIRATIAEAHRFGVVMSDDVIAKADELDRKFQAITTTISTGMKTAIVEVAAAMQSFIDEFKTWYDSLPGNVADRAKEAGGFIGSLAGTKPMQGPPIPSPTATPMPSSADLSTKFLADYRAELALTNRERAIAAEQEKILADAAKRGITISREQAAALAAESVAREDRTEATRRSNSESERSAKAAANEAARIRELISDLEFEKSTIGATNLEMNIANALRDAGAAATTKQQTAIIGLVAAIHSEAAARKQAADRTREMADLGRDVTSGIIQGLRDGASAADILTGALDKLLDKFVELALNSAFPNSSAAQGGSTLSSFFGGLFGGGASKGIGYFPPIPKFAKGTNSAPGGMAIVGERGPELVHLPRGSRVDPTVPAAAQSLRIHVTTGTSVDDDGKLSSYVKKVSVQSAGAVVQAMTPGIVDQSVARNGKALKRGEHDDGMAAFGLSRQAMVR